MIVIWMPKAQGKKEVYSVAKVQRESCTSYIYPGACTTGWKGW